MVCPRNLLLAVMANRHVARLMTVGASNKFGDVLKSYGGSLLCVPAIRRVDVSVPSGGIPPWIRSAAAKAAAAGCGNCGEQAALALVYLDELHIRPLDYMARTNADHAFVVIGRAESSRYDDFTTWGGDAVVCDPWDRKAYGAREIPAKMYGGGVFRPASLFRVS